MTVATFEEELRAALSREVDAARGAVIPNRIAECRSYLKTRSFDEEVNKVFVAVNAGKHIDAMLECLKEWNGEPMPMTTDPAPWRRIEASTEIASFKAVQR